MTSEHLSSRIRADDEIEALCSFLGQFFDEVHAVAYLRRPDHLAPSLFAEAVKAGRTKPLNAAFVEQRTRSFDHAAFLAQWTAVLGRTTWSHGRTSSRSRLDPRTWCPTCSASSRRGAGFPSWARARAGRGPTVRSTSP